MSPSRSALRRTRSACASSIPEECVFTPIPSEMHRSSASLFVMPSSLASSCTRILPATFLRWTCSGPVLVADLVHQRPSILAHPFCQSRTTDREAELLAQPRDRLGADRRSQRSLPRTAPSGLFEAPFGALAEPCTATGQC